MSSATGAPGGGWGGAGTGGVRGGGELALREEIGAAPEEWQGLHSVVVTGSALKSDRLGASSSRPPDWTGYLLPLSLGFLSCQRGKGWSLPHEVVRMK